MQINLHETPASKQGLGKVAFVQHCKEKFGLQLCYYWHALSNKRLRGDDPGLILFRCQLSCLLVEVGQLFHVEKRREANLHVWEQREVAENSDQCRGSGLSKGTKPLLYRLEVYLQPLIS